MPRRRLGKKLLKSLLPILLVLLVALVIALGSIVYGITHPPRRAYLVTPQDFKEISGTALKVSDETWRNRDGTKARGWLLRGSEGAPSVVLLHPYGGDRSWLFNLGIKLNEATGFTILWPDQRGHGLNPPVGSTTFGVKEGDDALAAFDFLKGLKTESGNRLVGERAGAYGVELGAYAAMKAAAQDPNIQVLVLDSIPSNADAIVDAAVTEDVGVSRGALLSSARFATHTYFMGKFDNIDTCELARGLKNQKIQILAGTDHGQLRGSTLRVQSCFANNGNLEVKTDLPITGMTSSSATGEEGERYDRPVIDFFVRNLR